jgi:hypothetical protein
LFQFTHHETPNNPLTPNSPYLSHSFTKLSKFCNIGSTRWRAKNGGGRGCVQWNPKAPRESQERIRTTFVTKMMKRKKLLYTLLANKRVRRNGCLILVLGSKDLHHSVVCLWWFGLPRPSLFYSHRYWKCQIQK